MTNMPFNFEEGEILLIDKPLHWTSADVTRKVRNATHIAKTGHAGTLDPLATGLLVVCVGRKATTQIDSLQDTDKEYTGIIGLGASTPSYDLETAIDQTFETAHLTVQAIEQTAKLFVGNIMQTAPIYSAIKVDGKPMYKKAHKGIAVEAKTRPVRIVEFEITQITLPDVHFRIVCGKGTYIRSIAHDLGKALQNGGHLKALRRTKSGSFDIKDAWQLEQLIEEIKRQRENAVTQKKISLNDMQ